MKIVNIMENNCFQYNYTQTQYNYTQNFTTQLELQLNSHGIII